MNSFIDEQQKLWNISDENTYIMGFSQGAMISIYTSLTRKTKLAGCIAVAGIMTLFGMQYFEKLVVTPFYEIPIKFLAINSFALAVLFVFRNTLQGIGKTYVSMIAGVSELVGRVVAALILSKLFGFFGVCLASPMAWVCADIPLLLIYYVKVIKRQDRK